MPDRMLTYSPPPPAPLTTPPLAPLVTLLVALLCAAPAVGCDDAAEPAPACVLIDAEGADSAAGADGGAAGLDDVASDGAVASDAWQLDACAAACDHAVACGAAQCVGYDWTSVGPLYVRCAEVCEAAPLSATPASSCADAVAELQARVPEFAASCQSNPCKNACTKLADCVVAGCEKVGAGSRAQLISGCVKTCTPQTAAWVQNAASCDALLGGIAAGDPAFEGNCHGGTSACADATSCAGYGDKLAGCLVQHCGSHAAPFEGGLAQALASYCSGDAKCPAKAAVAGILAPTTTCASPGLATFGDAPPFNHLCADTVGVSFADLGAACADLLACPGASLFVNVDVCRVIFAMRDDAASRVACLLGAKTCAARYVCLEGF